MLADGISYGRCSTVYIVVLIVLFHLFGPQRVSVSWLSSEEASGMGVDVFLVVDERNGNGLRYGIGGVMEKLWVVDIIEYDNTMKKLWKAIE
jgi:hypothetical protein